MSEEAKKMEAVAQGAEADVADIVDEARRRQAEEGERLRQDMAQGDDIRAQELEKLREFRERKRFARRRALSGTALFVGAACGVLAGMCAGMVSPLFAIPLAVIWFCRAAVRYDRYARRWK